MIKIIKIMFEQTFKNIDIFHKDAGAALGDLIKVKELFIEFQKYLYEQRVA